MPIIYGICVWVACFGVMIIAGRSEPTDDGKSILALMGFIWGFVFGLITAVLTWLFDAPNPSALLKGAMQWLTL